MEGHRPALAIAVAGSLILTACGGGQRNPAIQTVEIYSLSKALPQAKVQTAKPEMVTTTTFAVAGQRRNVLFMHPDSRAEFPAVKVTADSTIQFGIGINEVVWEKGGDGVVFSVLVRQPNGKQSKIFSRYLDPQHNVGERTWIDTELPLKAFADQEIRIVLETASGPKKDHVYDWGGWSNPQVVIPQS